MLGCKLDEVRNMYRGTITFEYLLNGRLFEIRTIVVDCDGESSGICDMAEVT